MEENGQANEKDGAHAQFCDIVQSEEPHRAPRREAKKVKQAPLGDLALITKYPDYYPESAQLRTFVTQQQAIKKAPDTRGEGVPSLWLFSRYVHPFVNKLLEAQTHNTYRSLFALCHTAVIVYSSPKTTHKKKGRDVKERRLNQQREKWPFSHDSQANCLRRAVRKDSRREVEH